METSIDHREDEAVIQEILAGNKEQYAILVRKYNTMLYRIGKAYGLSESDIEDAMQESFIQAYQQLIQLKRPRAFQKWLATIMVHICYHTKPYITPAELPMDMLDKKTTTDMDKRDIKHLLEQAILQLPPAYRLPFVLKELNGYSLKDTAQLLHLSLVNTKVRLFRARQMLKKTLQQQIPEQELLAFEAPRCERLTQSIMQIIAQPVSILQ
ncbi:MAG: sigma-70 family RNA polymerase sigma factor [Thermoflavifilum sp.]|nr:sigma-70 family RNA polymerase sigma factor [Thermoflavifilum sp.]